MVPFAVGLSLTGAERALADQVEALGASAIAPLAEAADGRDDLHPGLVEGIRGSGLFRHFVPVEHGGVGLSVTALALIRERLAYHSVAADEFYVSQGIPVQPISLFGSAEQRATYLPDLLAGRRVFSFCLTEPGAGSDVLGIRSTARAVGDGYVLTGTKRYPFAGDQADTLLVFAKTGPAGDRANLTALLVDRPDAGLTATRFPLMAPGPEWELRFDECVVPAKAKLVATETAPRVIDAALQYHGGVGLARGGIIERLYRAVRATRIYEGSAEVMKVVIARGLLGPE